MNNFLQVTNFLKQNNKAIPSKTLLCVNGTINIFDTPFKPPHELMHFFSESMILDLVTKLGLEYKIERTFSHASEIYTDLIEEVFKASTITKLQNESHQICVPSKALTFDFYDLVDTSILLLNLKKHHKIISKILKKPSKLLFPKYRTIWNSRSSFHQDLIEFDIHGKKSVGLKIIDDHLAEQDTSLLLLLDHAKFAFKVLHNILPKEYITDGHSNQYQFKIDSSLGKIVINCDDYTQKYFAYARNIKYTNTKSVNCDQFDEVVQCITPDITKIEFDQLINQHSSLFGYFLQ
ncbi:MAG: hypothetical protein H7196_03305 [candidate division SR1 bacterium]|nr:hypothetical protein [candidate division SR1 bacterium]